MLFVLGERKKQCISPPKVSRWDIAVSGGMFSQVYDYILEFFVDV